MKQFDNCKCFPIYMGEWNSNSIYAPLAIVQFEEWGYVALKPVPKGIQIDDTEYWYKLEEYVVNN